VFGAKHSPLSPSKSLRFSVCVRNEKSGAKICLGYSAYLNVNIANFVVVPIKTGDVVFYRQEMFQFIIFNADIFRVFALRAAPLPASSVNTVDEFGKNS
jgi:hypothetical protein